MFFLGIIPARSGSKGILNKNLCLLAGKPLIEYTVEAAKTSKMLSDWVITTDSEQIGAYCPQAVYRPQKLAEDDTPMLPVVEHAIATYGMRTGVNIDAVVLLQPTSPLRTASDIDEAIAAFCTEKADSLVSVTDGVHPIKCYVFVGAKFVPYIETTPVYDKHKYSCVSRNGAVFITKRTMLERGVLFDKDSSVYLMPKSRSIDIDYIEDLEMAEMLIKGGVLSQ